MNKKPASLQVLEKLHQIRQRAVEDTTSRLAQQKQLQQRYSNNIEALRALSDSSGGMAADAAQMHNQARFKATIQRVIDWQQQEKALASIEQEATRRELLDKASQEMTLNVVMEQQKVAIRQALERDRQKLTDAQAMQSWLRRHRSGKP
ncbi:flagellar export protein FliJ [Erwinia sp. SLM-02]|uniref:flagellar export protein FliJ n=1 Tax=Erwinia sp. SLM-02 TaxID=3020057 RepID=UPI0028D2D16D|nr:flagellar export protein FliJ [uncultured Erwinia sp.]